VTYVEVYLCVNGDGRILDGLALGAACGWFWGQGVSVLDVIWEREVLRVLIG